MECHPHYNKIIKCYVWGFFGGIKLNIKHKMLLKQLSFSAAVLAGLVLSAPVIGQQATALAETTQTSVSSTVNTTFTGAMYTNTVSGQSMQTPQTPNGFEHSLYFQATDDSGNLEDSNYALIGDNSTYRKTIINADHYKNLTMNFTITNNTKEDKKVNEIVGLPLKDSSDAPLIYDNSRGQSSIAPEADSQSEMVLTTYIAGKEYFLPGSHPASETVPADADWSTMDRFRVRGTLHPGNSWSIKIPLRLNLTDKAALDKYLYSHNWATLTDYSYAPDDHGVELRTKARIAQQDSLSGGKYLATVENKDGSFTPLPKNVQDLMPQIGANGEIFWENLNDGDGPVQGDVQTKLFSTLDHVGFTGSFFYLDLTKIGSLKASNGYPLEQALKALGYDFAPDASTNKTATSYYYQFNGVTPNFSGGGNGGLDTGGTGSIQLRLYKVTPVPLPVTPSNNHGGGSSSNTNTNTNGNTTPSTNPNWNPTTPNKADGTTGLPNYAAVKGTAVYSTKAIYMYSDPTFSKSDRIAKYTKRTRVNRPMFVVTGYAKSNGGALRYKVRDVNKQSKHYGKTGYITANKNYVLNVYSKRCQRTKRSRSSLKRASTHTRLLA